MLNRFPGGSAGLCSFEPLVIFLLADRHRTLFYVCFCSRTLYLIHIADSLTLNSMSEESSSNSRIFSVRQITGFLLLGTLDGTSTWHQRVILNSEITNKKRTNVKNMAWDQQKRTLVYRTRAELWRQMLPNSASAGSTCMLDDSVFPALCTSLMTTKSPGYWFGGEK